MTTVIFVHGTGVREPHYSDSLLRFATGLGPLRPDVTVAPCYWGGRAGAALRSGGASVPGYATGRSAPGGGPGDEEAEVELWGLLYLDPLLEIRLRADRAGPPSETAPGAVPEGEALAFAARAIAAGATDGADLADPAHPADPADRTAPTTAGLLDALGVRADFVPAVNSVLADADCRRMLRTAGGDDEAILLARAIVAESVRRAIDRADTVPALDGGARDRLVAHLVRLLPGGGASQRGPLRAVGRLTARMALGLVSAQAVKRRRSLTDAAHPAAGDVLLYLARGEAIREHIAAAVRAARPPVVLVAHSLGGIAALDLLVLRPELEVSALVTVGSQAPFLYEIGALPSLEFGRPLPPHIPPWLNFYDRRDLLGYIGAGVFPGRVRDIALDSRQPFPLAHSAYWANPELYAVLAAELPKQPWKELP